MSVLDTPEEVWSFGKNAGGERGPTFNGKNSDIGFKMEMPPENGGRTLYHISFLMSICNNVQNFFLILNKIR